MSDTRSRFDVNLPVHLAGPSGSAIFLPFSNSIDINIIFLLRKRMDQIVVTLDMIPSEPEYYPDRIYPTMPLQYEPERWNKSGLVQKFNCYAYALNTQKHGWLPLYGRLNAMRPNLAWPETQEFNLRMPPSLRASIELIRDGLVPIRKHEFGPNEAHIVAYDSYADHFFRLDKHGIWSHKPGKHSVTNRDDKGDIVTDPEHGWFGFRQDIPRGSISAHFSYYRLPEAGMRVFSEQKQCDVSQEWPNYPFQLRKLMEYGFDPQVLLDIMDQPHFACFSDVQRSKIAEQISENLLQRGYDPLHYWRLMPHMSRYSYD